MYIGGSKLVRMNRERYIGKRLRLYIQNRTGTKQEKHRDVMMNHAHLTLCFQEGRCTCCPPSPPNAGHKDVIGGGKHVKVYLDGSSVE